MSPEKVTFLHENFPLLYRQKIHPDCSDGWFHLILCLSIILEGEIKKERQRYPDYIEGFYASQIKEKYGKLRFYMSSLTKEMDDLIDDAEEKSARICEECGSPAKREEVYGWVKTLCSACKEKEIS